MVAKIIAKKLLFIHKPTDYNIREKKLLPCACSPKRADKPMNEM